MNAKNVCVITDKNLEKLPPMRAALDSLHANKINYELFSDVSIEPTDHRCSATSILSTDPSERWLKSSRVDIIERTEMITRSPYVYLETLIYIPRAEVLPYYSSP